MQLIPVVNKADFKYFKPWLPDYDKEPEWADQLGTDTLKNVLTKDSNEGQNALKVHQDHWKAQKKRLQTGDEVKAHNNVELPLSFYQKWKCNDKVKSYADLAPPRVEPRLAEIYRKFSHKLNEFKSEIH